MSTTLFLSSPRWASACVSINGANRLGSNSLTELLVFGARAGRAAAQFAREHEAIKTSALESQVRDEQRRITERYLTRDGGTERIAAVRSDLWHAMEEGAGIYRTEASLQKMCDTLSELHERCQNVGIDDRSNCFNTELTAALELQSMLDVAGALVHSALERKESRGSHQRTDYPDRNDKKYLKHSLAYRSDKGPARIKYIDVTITKWPPGERVYGTEPAAAR